MKLSVKLGVVVAAGVLATASVVTAQAMSGSDSVRAAIIPVGPPPQYAGAVATTCDVQTDVAANHKKIAVGVTITVAGTGTPVGEVAITLDGVTKTFKKYAGGLVTHSFGGLTAGTHALAVTYTAPYSSVFANCSYSASIPN